MTSAISDRITLCRVLCIAGMIYVHVPLPTRMENSLTVPGVGGFDVLHALLVDGLGRASAGLLSLVSGLLVAHTLLKANASITDLYRRRAMSILLPMTLWGALTLVVYLLLSMVRPTVLAEVDGGLLDRVMGYVNFIWFVTDMPYGPTLHLAFLRDLFMCVLLSPLLIAALRLSAPVTILALMLVYLFQIDTVIVLRPLIVLCFTLGLWLSLRRVSLSRLDEYWAIWASLAVLMPLILMDFRLTASTPVLGWLDAHGVNVTEAIMYPLIRLFGGLAIWTLAARLVGTSLGQRLMWLGPFVFVAYCSHFMLLTFVHDLVWLPLFNGGRQISGFWFVVAPAVAFAGAWLIVRELNRFMPKLAIILTGGRLPGPGGPAAARVPGRPG